MSGSKTKRLALLGGILAAVCGITLILLHLEQKKEDIRTSGEVILEIPTESVTAVSWSSEEKPSVSLHREDGHWYADGDDAFPVDDEKIEELLIPFAAFTAAFQIEEPDDLAVYGLDQPMAELHLTAGEEETVIQLGDISEMDAQRYVSIGDGKVYLAAKDPFLSIDVLLGDLIENDEIPHFGEITSLELTGAEPLSITWQAKGGPSLRESDHYFTQHRGEEVPLDTALVEDYLQALSRTALTDFVTYDVTEEELSEFGLVQPQLTVQITYPDPDGGKEQTFTLAVSRDPAQLPAPEEDDPEEIIAYARVADSPIVYQLTPDDYTALMACGFDDLRHRQVLPADYEAVTQMTVTLDSQTYALSVEGESLRYLDAEVEGADVQNALTALTVQEFTDQRSTGAPELGLRLTMKDGSAVTMSLDRFDGEQCLAVVDGVTLGLVDRSQVVELVEAIHAIVLGQPNTNN